jgi:hypothetical protein
MYILAIYYSGMHFLIKNTFLAFYLRLSPNRIFRLLIGVGFGLNIGLLFINILLLVFQCIPVSAALSVLGRLKAECMNQDFTLYGPATVVCPYLAPLPVANVNASFRTCY